MEATGTPSSAGSSEVRVQSCALDTFSIQLGQSVSCLIAVCYSYQTDRPAGNYGNTISFLWKLVVNKVLPSAYRRGWGLALWSRT